MQSSASPLRPSAEFLEQIQPLKKTLEYPDPFKQAVSTVAHATNVALRAVGIESGVLNAFGHPHTHILGETFCTLGPIRYGDYVAKIFIQPSSESLQDLTGKHVNVGEGFNPLEMAVKEFFRTNTAVWDVRAQLCVDSTAALIEDLSKEWPEEQTPLRTVGTITVGPQDSYSDARQIFVDEQMSFNPWHALAAHQPLGGVMRARRLAYAEAQKYRSQRNLRAHIEPKDL